MFVQKIVFTFMIKMEIQSMFIWRHQPGGIFLIIFIGILEMIVLGPMMGTSSEQDGRNLYYILNGEQSLLGIANIPVKSEDQLLIYFGTGTYDDVMRDIYPLVSKNAHEYNEKQDPASCSTNAQGALLDGFLGGISVAWDQIKERFPHSHNKEDSH
ncbi:MAG: hypothetical protein HHAS10_11850 [Candidatus Altimarinota bacterium]